jgi:hypothetical protein
MSVFGFLSAIALLGIAAVYGQAVKDPVEPNPVRVSSRAQVIASLEQASVKLGAPMVLHYRLKNVSPQAIQLLDDCSFSYWVMVTDASGTELPLAREGRRRRGPPSVLAWWQAGAPPPAPTEVQASCTFNASYNPTTGAAIQGPNNGASGTYWYGDALVMKAYASGTSETNPPYIQWNGKSFSNYRDNTVTINGVTTTHNFVYEFCTCQSTAGCQRSTPPANQ